MLKNKERQYANIKGQHVNVKTILKVI